MSANVDPYALAAWPVGRDEGQKMHPKTFAAYQAIKAQGDHMGFSEAILAGLHLNVSAGIAKAAEAFAVHEIHENGFAEIPVGARIPATCTVLTFEGGPETVLVCLQDEDRVHLWQLCPRGKALRLGAYSPGSKYVWSNPDVSADYGDEVTRFIGFVAFTVSLVNEPRRVTVSAAKGLDFTRQYQKQVKRKTGMAVMAYSTVSWQVGAGVKAKNSKDGDSDLKVALHYSRSHWRQCAPDNIHAEWVSKFRGGAPGWHQWIKGAWKGHPDHGIKLQRYEPRMPGEKRMSPSHARRVEQDSAAALETLSEEIRAKLVQAGHAPSMAVN